MSSSFANLADLVDGGPGLPPLAKPASSSALSADSSGARSEDRPDRLIMVSNQLPVRMKRREGGAAPGAGHGWEFEWDEDSLVGQAKAGIEQPQFQTIQARSRPAQARRKRRKRAAPNRARSHWPPLGNAALGTRLRCVWRRRGRDGPLQRLAGARRQFARCVARAVRVAFWALRRCFATQQVLYVGCLPQEVDGPEQDAVSSDLFARFCCLPGAPLCQSRAPLSQRINGARPLAPLTRHAPAARSLPGRRAEGALLLGALHRSAGAARNTRNPWLCKARPNPFSLGLQRFCKQTLWPLMHYLLPLSPTSLGRFDRSLWGAYLTANKKFSDRLMEIISPDDDYIWVHDYHLLVLPSFLRKRFNTCRLGFFLHCPFPSSEVFRSFPAREAVLRALLNSDVIGFHTFDYARHFLSCCSRMLGLAYQSTRGALGIDYYGRKIGIKICPTGINTQRLRRGLSAWPEAIWRQGELVAQFSGKAVLVGVDDMDVFKGIELKLRAFEALLAAHPELRGKVSLVQVAHPARSQGKDVLELQTDVHAAVAAINRAYGEPGEKAPPVVLLERHVPLHERIALYAVADCAVVTATRDGMNLVPYEYVACRQGPERGGEAGVDGAAGDDAAEAMAAEQPGGVQLDAPPPAADPFAGEAPRNSMLVVSEFVGCSPSLSGAIRVNPWNIEATADALYRAISMPAHERAARHEKHWRYVREHTAGFWAASNFAELQRACRGHASLRCYGLGFGLNFRIVALDPNFRKLPMERVQSAYTRAHRRLLVFDYDGTLVAASAAFPARPPPELVAALTALAADAANCVYIVSGRRKALLDDWFGRIPGLGVSAEHGAYLRQAEGAWEELAPTAGGAEDGGRGSAWREVVLPILELYTESTDGSFIERKESALVWHYGDADPDFGSTQAKELLDHMESVLANEPVEVVAGAGTVEIKPQGVSKGLAVSRILELAASAPAGANFDFELCMGDDRSDEEMYAALETRAREAPSMLASDALFNCTVGQKPSRAAYFLNDPAEALELLQTLSGEASGTPRLSSAQPGGGLELGVGRSIPE
jgi:trehalose 6-phosphate synthase/phosphatase